MSNSFPNLKQIHLTDDVFRLGTRCVSCEKRNYEFCVNFANNDSQHYCRDCLANHNAIACPAIHEDRTTCYGCSKYVRKSCFFIGISRSGGGGYEYCKRCIRRLITQTEKLGIKLESIFYEFASSVTIRTSLPKGIRHEVLNRDNHTCKECGTTKDDEPLEVDHIVPISRGGTDELSNLQTLCRTCNREKSDLIFKGGSKT